MCNLAIQNDIFYALQKMATNLKHSPITTKEGRLFLYQYEEISKKVQVNKYFYHMKCLELPSNKTKYV